MYACASHAFVRPSYTCWVVTSAPFFFSSIAVGCTVVLPMLRPNPDVAAAARVRRAARKVRMVEVNPKRNANHGRIAVFFTGRAEEDENALACAVKGESSVTRRTVVDVMVDRRRAETGFNLADDCVWDRDVPDVRGDFGLTVCDKVGEGDERGEEEDGEESQYRCLDVKERRAAQARVCEKCGGEREEGKEGDEAAGDGDDDAG